MTVFSTPVFCDAFCTLSCRPMARLATAAIYIDVEIYNVHVTVGSALLLLAINIAVVLRICGMGSSEKFDLLQNGGNHKKIK